MTLGGTRVVADRTCAGGGVSCGDVTRKGGASLCGGAGGRVVYMEVHVFEEIHGELNAFGLKHGPIMCLRSTCEYV